MDECSGTGYTSDSETIVHDCCPAYGSHTLKCKDSYGDGWHGGYIFIDGKRYCDDFSTGSLQTETVVFGSASSLATEKSFSSLQLSQLNISLDMVIKLFAFIGFATIARICYTISCNSHSKMWTEIETVEIEA